MFAHDTFLRQIEKAVIAAIAFAVPVFVTTEPAIANLTIGGVLFAFVSWLQALAA